MGQARRLESWRFLPTAGKAVGQACRLGSWRFLLGSSASCLQIVGVYGGHMEKRQKSAGELRGEGRLGRGLPQRTDVGVVARSVEMLGWPRYPVVRVTRLTELLRESRASSGSANIDGRAI